MHSAKNYLIALLTVTTIAGAVVSWRQHQELAVLRATALNPNERAAWQQRLWDAEKRRAELEQQVAALPPGPREDAGAATPADAFPPPPGVRGTGRGAGGGRFAAMMEQPEIQRLLAVQQKAALDSRYAALFKNLALSPEQLEKFKNLLVEKSTAAMDVMMAAREQGINPRRDREAFDKLVADTQSEIDTSIRDALGETAFAQYQDYERTLPQRAVTDQLEQRLSYSSTPLTAEQSNSIVSILAANQPGTAGGGSDVFFAGAVAPRAAVAALGGRGQAAITDTAIQQSAGVLAAPQIEALRQLQQEQQAQRDLGAAFRNQGTRAAGTSASAAVTAPPPPPPDGG